MRKAFLKGSPLSDYLKEVEKKEHAQKRRIAILLVGLFASIAVVSFLYFSTSSSPIEGEPIPFEDLEIKSSQTIISQGIEAEVWDEEKTFSRDSIICIIEGEFLQHEPVYFHIANYNDQNTYVIEYGDGNRQIIPERHAFIFDRPGKYQVKIIAFYPDLEGYIKTTQTLQIGSNFFNSPEQVWEARSS